MSAAVGLEWFRDMLWVAVIVGAPPIVVSLVVGLFMAVVQAATQINDSALAFAPKAIATLVAIVVAGGWMLARIGEFAASTIAAMSRAHP